MRARQGSPCQGSVVPGPIPILILTPPTGPEPAELWMAAGRLAAARDLVRLLTSMDGIGPIYVLAAEAADRESLVSLGGVAWQGPGGPFHFGRALAGFAAWSHAERFAYFGGASAPLLKPDLLLEAIDRLDISQGPAAVVNNCYSTDWALFNHAQALLDLADKLPTDNPIGWVLGHDSGHRVHALAPSAATRADVDTPADLLLLARHPQLGPEVEAFLSQAPADCRGRVEAIRAVMKKPASNLTIIGRSSSHLWQSIERRAEIWVRLLIEERGMVASGRMERGEVRTLVGEILDAWGPRAFIERLAEMTDAVLWDTRVWMAARGGWPSSSDRFAADLGWADQVQDPGLHDLTQAINAAPIPVLTGGHGVVSGSLYALVETLEETAPGQTSA